METKTWQEIAEEIKSDEEINFIGRAISPLHTLGVEAYILSLKDKGVALKGYILAVSHESTGISLSEERFHTDLYEGITPIILKCNGGLKTKLSNLRDVIRRRNNKKEFYFVNPYRPEFNFISEIADIRKTERIRVVITDEGLGTYVNNPYSIRKNKAPYWSIKDLIRFTIYSRIRDSFLHKWFLRENALEYFLMLKKEEGKWIRNSVCADNIIKVLKSRKIDDDYLMYEDSVLICPSLIYEAGILKSKQDVDIYKALLDELDNPKCIVKPHPREKDIQKYEMLGCLVERRHKVSTEEILANINKLPKCVVGESSTILVSAAALFGIKAISISKLIDKNDLSDATYFNRFNDIFAQVVCAPATMDELTKVLEML